VAEEKLVSVIIPTFNRADMLKRAIQSAIFQDHHSLEIIVVDDASSDRTQQVVKSFNDDRIIFLRNAENKGVSFSRNVGLMQAKGEFIAFLDSDDEFEFDKIKEQVKLFEDLSPKPGLVFSNYWEIGEDKVLAVSDSVESGRVGAENRFPADVFCGPPGWMISRECFEKTGMFDEGLRTLEDIDYFARIVRNFSAYFISKPLSRVYVHGCQLGSVSSKFVEGTRERFLEKWSEEMGRDKKYLSNFYYVTGKDLLKGFELGKAAKYLWKGCFCGKFNIRAIRKLLKLYLIWACNLVLPYKKK
jgi:glycosyltransferase involved in cell wall biosynthesis